MRVVLAPMEGVLDHQLRSLLTQVGQYDLCVTEFIRIVDQVLPDRVYFRSCPELIDAGPYGSVTSSGTPVRVQLLGQDENYMAENAVKAVELGSSGIDINFGCPAKTVNKNRGGAVLLKNPENLYRIMDAVKNAVPKDTIVSAKIRLGYEDKTLAIENAQAIESANTNELTVHARTKLEGYKPPAHWEWIAKIKEHVNIPIIANGEIWTLDDAKKCREITGCKDIMVGRGALALPNFAQVLKQEESIMSWQDVQGLLFKYTQFEVYGDKSRYYPNRIKQWLRYLKIQYPQADELFQTLRTLKTAQEIRTVLERKV
jgi:tRNA-dihydrouridine synthase C